MADIKVTVEPPLENQIVEVTYDGQEIIQPPLTQAENLMRQVSNFILKDLKILISDVCMFSTADLEIKNVPNPLRRYHLSAICPEDI